MKGVSFVTNEMNEKIAVQIDLKLLNRYNDGLETCWMVSLQHQRKRKKGYRLIR